MLMVPATCNSIISLYCNDINRLPLHCSNNLDNDVTAVHTESTDATFT